MKIIDGHDVIEHAEVNGESREFIRKLMDYIEDAPVVEPKQGRWIDCKDPTTIGYECSECGKYCAEVEFIPECDFMSPVWNYCPNCGCRMKGADNETD